MTEELVTARVTNESHLREDHMKVDQIVYLPGSFTSTNPRTGQSFECKFKDANGLPAQSFGIKTQLPFNLNNAIEKHNFDTLKLFLMAYPDFSNLIKLHDPQEEANKEDKLLQLSFKITSKIVEMSSNTDWMAKLYRAIFGFATGITEQKIRVELLKRAKDDASKFLAADGGLIYEDETFEMMALVNVALEKGLLSRDQDGYIRTSSGGIYADNAIKASYILASDDTLKEKIEFELSGRKQIEPTPFVPQVENSELMRLMETVGEIVQTDSFRADGTIDTEANEELVEAEMVGKIDKLVQAKFIEEVKGPFGQPRYKIPGLPNKFKHEELPGYFKVNVTQYNDLLSRAKIK